MTKEDLIQLLKNNRENIGSLKLRKNDLRRYKAELKELEKIEAEKNMGTSYGFNSDIHSKNKIGDKVSQAIIRREERKAELKQKIKEHEEEIKELQEKVSEAEIRLNALKYRERKIVIAYYVDDRTAEDISRNLYWSMYNRTCTARYIQNIIKKAIEKMINL